MERKAPNETYKYKCPYCGELFIVKGDKPNPDGNFTLAKLLSAKTLLVDFQVHDEKCEYKILKKYRDKREGNNRL